MADFVKYQPKTWASREFIKRTDMNHLEEGVGNNSEAIDALIDDVATKAETTALNEEIARAQAAEELKLNAPAASFGTEGQLLRTRGDGTTEWATFGSPSSAQVDVAVSEWLDEHPEVTTTVEDGAITEAKLATGLATKVGKIETTEADVAELKSAVLTDDAKLALLACFQKVAWIDEQGQTYYNTLHDSLFPTAVSISATFIPGSHVFYETDALDALRPYLLVRATMPDNSVKVVTNYTLTGAMEVGTSTITVHYQELTDVFTVTVQANPAYITAVFTQPQTVIYTDDALDTLKSNLVVTYYANQGAQGVVVPASDYTLSGTLVDGLNTVLVQADGLVTSVQVEAVDYYNQMYYSLSSGSLTKLVGGAVMGERDYAGNVSISGYNDLPGIRRSVWTEKGRKKITAQNTFTKLDYYPIPIPNYASKAIITVTPNTQYVAPNVYRLTDNVYTKIQNDTWYQGSVEFTMNDIGTDDYLTINMKADNAGSSYTVEPTEVTVTFVR